MNFTLAELGSAIVLLGGVVGLWWRSTAIRSRLDGMATREEVAEETAAIRAELAALDKELSKRIETRASKAEVIQHGNILQTQGLALASIKAELEGLGRRLDDRMDHQDHRIAELLELVRQLIPRGK